MPLYLQAEAAFALLLAALLGGVIGMDRESADRAAGFRTHMLVCIGSCLFTILSAYAFEGGDPGRIAAQVVSGMGFLGAGAILKERGTIVGLTTAASMWTTAAIGMALGSGAWLLSLVGTVIVWTILSIMPRVTSSKRSKSHE